MSDGEDKVESRVPWLRSATSGIVHVPGVGFTRKECNEGVQLLCGWVLTRETVSDPSNTRRCVTCRRWLRLYGTEGVAFAVEREGGRVEN